MNEEKEVYHPTEPPTERFLEGGDTEFGLTERAKKKQNDQPTKEQFKVPLFMDGDGALLIAVAFMFFLTFILALIVMR